MAKCEQNPIPHVQFNAIWCFVLALACSLYIAMRFWGLADYCLDGDEIFSLRAARQDFGGLLATAVADISHPPLFYLVLKLWIAIGGQSLFWLRLLPAIISIATLIPVYLLCRELRLRPWETAMAVAMLALNGFVIHYAQHLRMFVLLQFFAAWSTWVLIRLVTSPRTTWLDWLICFLVNLGLIYSHYWGWMFLGTELLVLLIIARAKTLPVLVLGGALVISYIPWAYAVLKCAADKGAATTQISWIKQPSWHDIVWFFGSLNGTFEIPRSTTAGLLLFGIPVLLFCYRTKWSLRTQGFGQAAFFVSMFALAFVPVIATYLVSNLLTQSVWAERQLVIVALPYFILVVVAACQLKKSWSRVVFASAMLIWALSSCLAMKTGPAQKISWDSLVESIHRSEKDSANPTIVYTMEGFVATPLDFYANDGGVKWLDARISPSLERFEGEHFWVAIRDTQWKEDCLPQAKLADMGFHVGEAFSAGTKSQTITVFPVWR